MYDAGQPAHGILYTTPDFWRSGVGSFGLGKSCLMVKRGLKQTRISREVKMRLTNSDTPRTYGNTVVDFHLGQSDGGGDEGVFFPSLIYTYITNRMARLVPVSTGNPPILTNTWISRPTTHSRTRQQSSARCMLELTHIPHQGT